MYLNTSTTSGNATFPPSGYVRPVWWKHIKSLYFFVKCCEWMLSTGLRVIQRICVFTVGFWSDAVGADDSGADPLRRHWPFRDVGLPKRRVQNSTTNQLSRWAVSCPPPPPHILCIFTYLTLVRVGASFLSRPSFSCPICRQFTDVNDIQNHSNTKSTGIRWVRYRSVWPGLVSVGLLL